MAECNAQSDLVEVTRILDEIRQLRSGLAEHRRPLERPVVSASVVPERPSPTPFAFDEHTIYASSRKLVRLVRKSLNPILKLFFNPTVVALALTRQAEINAAILQLPRQQADLVEHVTKQVERVIHREELDAPNWELLNNLAVEMTRLAVGLKNDKRHVESVARRLERYERRIRSLEERVTSVDKSGPNVSSADCQ